MFAVYSPRDEVIYGLGGTRHEAARDAVANGATLGEPYYHPSAEDLGNAATFGTLVVLPCTGLVADLVAEYGGDPSLWPGNKTLGIEGGVIFLLPEGEGDA